MIIYLLVELEKYINFYLGSAGLKLMGTGTCFQGGGQNPEHVKQSVRWRFKNGWQNQLGWKEFEEKFRKMKFYLAFENAFYCKDYVSEKLWRNAFETGLVPVVYGPLYDDVKNHAPPNSFIFAQNFKSPKELGILFFSPYDIFL